MSGNSGIDGRDVRVEELDSDDLQASEDGLSKHDIATQTLIGHHLKAVYREIIEEPIPDRFLKLMEELDRKEENRG